MVTSLGKKELHFLSRLYDELYNTASRLREKENPCNIIEGHCKYRKYGCCCSGCEYLSDVGCTVKSLSCKLWLCKESRRDKPILAIQLDLLSQIALRNHL